MTTGCTCLNCGVLTSWDQTHTCYVPKTRTAPSPLPTYSAGPRKYHITGTIGPRNGWKGEVHAVDLVVEALP